MIRMFLFIAYLSYETFNIVVVGEAVRVQIVVINDSVKVSVNSTRVVAQTGWQMFGEGMIGLGSLQAEDRWLRW